MGVPKGQSLLSQGEKRILRNLGARIREIRERAGLSVYDVTGDDMPIKSRQHWQQIEAGKRNMNLTTLLKVARSLEARGHDLLKGL